MAGSFPFQGICALQFLAAPTISTCTGEKVKNKVFIHNGRKLVLEVFNRATRRLLIFAISSDEVEKIKHLGECFNPINIYLSLLREIGVCKLGLLYLKRTIEERNAPYSARWSYVCVCV